MERRREERLRSLPRRGSRDKAQPPAPERQSTGAAIRSAEGTAALLRLQSDVRFGRRSSAVQRRHLTAFRKGTPYTLGTLIFDRPLRGFDDDDIDGSALRL